MIAVASHNSMIGIEEAIHILKVGGTAVMGKIIKTTRTFVPISPRWGNGQ